MQKKRTSRNTLKIVAATAMSIFSLTAVFAATLTWFAFNQGVDSTGMALKVNDEGNSLNILTIHRCNLSESTDSKLVFFSNPAVVVSDSGIIQYDNPVMDNYSDLNQTQPMLLLFGLNDGVKESDVTIKATSDNEEYVRTITADNISAFPFSTTVRFQSASFTGAAFPFNNVPIASLTQESSFVTITNHSFDSFSQEINIFTGSDGNRTITYVAVIMDYYPEAREVLLTNNVGVDILAANNNNVINFVCDWTLEI